MSRKTYTLQYCDVCDVEIFDSRASIVLGDSCVKFVRQVGGQSAGQYEDICKTCALKMLNDAITEITPRRPKRETRKKSTISTITQDR